MCTEFMVFIPWSNQALSTRNPTTTSSMCVRRRLFLDYNHNMTQNILLEITNQLHTTEILPELPTLGILNKFDNRKQKMHKSLNMKYRSVLSDVLKSTEGPRSSVRPEGRPK